MNNTRASAFTVDVEDGISIAMRDAFTVDSPQTDRVVHLTEKILELLSRHGIKGTFFVLGVVADEFPELVKRIATENHELGVHGYNHLQFFKMNREEAFRELDRAKKLIEDISGKAVYGHRAPAFSITPETKWGLDVIAEAGFEYDSSIMPISGIRYGWPGFSENICNIKTPAGHDLTEVPMSVVKLPGRKIPVCGGGYLRLFPEWITNKAFESIIQKRPAIVYIHPYELDTEKYPEYYFDELKKSGFFSRNKMKSMWINRKSVYSKLSTLLEKYEFEPLISIVKKRDHEEEKKV